MNVIRVKLVNYLSFKTEEIKFDKDKDGIFLVTGRNDENADTTDQNGAGKTAFISAFRFAISGKSRGQFTKDLVNEDVIYKDENDEVASKCVVETDVHVRDAYYRINRQVKSNGSQNLEFYTSSDNENWISLTLKADISKRTGKRESGITRTQERIYSVFGFDDEMFCNSAYFEQANIDTFARGTLAEKDNIFKSAIGISKWTDYTLLMRDDLSELTASEKAKVILLDDIGDIDELKCARNDARDLLTDLDEKIIAGQSYFDEKAKTLQTTANKMDKLVQKKFESELKLSNQESELANVLSYWSKITKWLDNTKNELEISKVRRDDTLTKIHNLKNHGVSLNAKLVKLKKPKESMETLEAQWDKYKHSEVTANAQIVVLSDSISDLEDAECPLGLSCVELTESKVEKLILGHRKKIKGHQAEIQQARQAIDSVDKKTATLRTIAALESELCDMRTIYADTVKLEKTLLKKNITLFTSISKTQEEADNLSDKIDEIKLAIADSVESKLQDKINDISTCISEMKISLIRAEKNLACIKEEKTEVQHELKSMEQKYARHTVIKSEFDAIQNRKRIIKDAMFVVGKDIPHVLLSQSIPEVQDYVQEFIAKLSDSRIDMEFRMIKGLKTKTKGETQEANAFDPWACIDGRWLKYQQTSGGERARIDVAIHLGWVCFKASRCTNIETLFLDEVGAALDKTGISKLIELLIEIMDTYGFKKIFYITQNPDAKKLLDNRIEVVKTADGSKVRFG